MPAKPLLDNDEQVRVTKAIRTAERMTSGEIRVHMEKLCRIDVLDRAAYVFRQLEMHKTAERNGVLFYISTKDRKFAILGDIGINAVVGEGFWDTTSDITISHFKKGEIVEGLEAGIRSCGEHLKKHFPRLDDDVNELSDEVSFGK